MSNANLPVPPLPAPGESDFLALLQNLLPRGRAWPTDPEANWTALLSGFALAQANARINQVALAVDEFPTTTEALVPEWELTLGLPDPCLGANPMMAARKAAIDARVKATGGQSVPYFEALAESLGGEIAITEFAPYRIGIDTCWSPIRCEAWAFAFDVTLDQGALFLFELGVSAAWEPLWQIASQPIACEIIRLKPGHTEVDFALAPGVVGGAFFYADLSLTDTWAGAA